MQTWMAVFPTPLLELKIFENVQKVGIWMCQSIYDLSMEMI